MGCLTCSSHRTSCHSVSSWTTWTSKAVKAVSGNSIFTELLPARMTGSTTFMVRLLRMIRSSSIAIEQVREQVQTHKLQMNLMKEPSCFPRAFQSHPRCFCRELKSSLTSMRTQLTKLIPSDQFTVRIWWVPPRAILNNPATRTVWPLEHRVTRRSKWPPPRPRKWAVESPQWWSSPAKWPTRSRGRSSTWA